MGLEINHGGGGSLKPIFEVPQINTETLISLNRVPIGHIKNVHIFAKNICIFFKDVCGIYNWNSRWGKASNPFLMIPK